MYYRLLARESALLFSIDRAWTPWRVNRVRLSIGRIHCGTYIVLCTTSSCMTELNLLAEASE